MSKSAVNPKKKMVAAAQPNGAYQSLVGGIAGVIEDAKRTAARSVNAAMTAAYWLVGRHILQPEPLAPEAADRKLQTVSAELGQTQKPPGERK